MMEGHNLEGQRIHYLISTGTRNFTKTRLGMIRSYSLTQELKDASIHPLTACSSQQRPWLSSLRKHWRCCRHWRLGAPTSRHIADLGVRVAAAHGPFLEQQAVNEEKGQYSGNPRVRTFSVEFEMPTMSEGGKKARNTPGHAHNDDAIPRPACGSDCLWGGTSAPWKAVMARGRTMDRAIA